MVLLEPRLKRFANWSSKILIWTALISWTLHSISVNKNTVHGDKSALSPGGIRLGTAALTTRGFDSANMQRVAELIHNCIQLALRVQGTFSSSKVTMKDFNEAIPKFQSELTSLKNQVEQYASSFPVPTGCNWLYSWWFYCFNNKNWWWRDIADQRHDGNDDNINPLDDAVLFFASTIINIFVFCFLGSVARGRSGGRIARRGHLLLIGNLKQVKRGSSKSI